MTLMKMLNDNNIFKLWNKHATQNPLNDLNPDKEFDDKKLQIKKLLHIE